MAENSKIETEQFVNGTYTNGGMAYDAFIGMPGVELVIGTARDGTPLHGNAPKTAPDGYGVVHAAYTLEGDNALFDAQRICEAWNAFNKELT